jgi:uncharacterized protein YxjI
MFKKILLSIIACFSLTSSIHADVASSQIGTIPTIPTEFYVEQHWLSWTSAFDIQTKEMKLGTVYRKFSLFLEYDFYNIREVLQAKAKARIFSFGATFDLEDNEGNPIGIVNQKIFTFFPTFEIISPYGQILGTAKMNFWGTKYTLTDPVSEREIAVLSRPFFRLKDDWTVKITNLNLFIEKQIDLRLFITLAAFQTDLDYWIAQEVSRQQQTSQPVQFKKSINTSSVEALAIHAELQSHKETLMNVEPTEKDFTAVQQRIATLLEASESPISEEQMEQMEGEKVLPRQLEMVRLTSGLSMLRNLLEGDELSPNEKSALIFLMEQKFNNLQ